MRSKLNDYLSGYYSDPEGLEYLRGSLGTGNLLGMVHAGPPATFIENVLAVVSDKVTEIRVDEHSKCHWKLYGKDEF